MPHPISKRALRAVILITGITVFLIQCFEYINFTVDDVFISFRYAEQVFRGHGYVYNVGEFVEGYSNWLWVTILVGFARAGWNQSAGMFNMLWAAKALSFVFGCFNIFLVHRLARRIIPAEHTLARYTPFLLFTTSGAYALWTMGAMEVQLCTMFYLIAGIQAVVIIKIVDPAEVIPSWRYLVHGLAWFGAMITRPEPFMHAGISFFFILLFVCRRERLRVLFFSVTPALLLFVLFLAWRYSTYHELVPNTYYAKTAFYITRLYAPMKYELSALGMLGGPFLLFAFIPLLRRQWERITWYSVFMLAGTMFFVCMANSDWMPGYRFYMPTYCFFALLVACGVHKVLSALSATSFPGVAPLAAVIFILCGAFSRVAADRTHIRSIQLDNIPGFRKVKGHSLCLHEAAADWLHAHEPVRPVVVATGEAGLIGYKNLNMQLVDCNGLMEAHIAKLLKSRQGFSADYVLDRKPDYVILFIDAGKDDFPELQGSEKDYMSVFIHMPRFNAEYAPVYEKSILHIYKRK
jgi:arabinofuranosyltransferase